jgi:phosphoenolpyruvate phosphomutase
MKAIILAAGMGTRLKHLTENKPKGLLEFNSKSLIEHQLDTLKRCGVDEVIIVRGYMAHKIDFPGVKYYVNKDYDKTNMVETLFCAEEELEDEVLVSYADIIYEDNVLTKIMASDHGVSVIVDDNWEEYFTARLGGDPLADAESLIYDERGFIKEIGRKNPELKDVQGQYVGLIKFKGRGIKILKDVYHRAREEYWDKPWQRGRLFQNTYMTDLLQAIIDSEAEVFPVKIHNGWLEFDTVEDYENILRWQKEEKLARFYSVNES